MRKIISAILIVIICNISIISYAENSTNEKTSSSETSKDLSQLQSQQQELQNKMQEVGQDLNEVQDELTENLQQIQIIDEKIEQVQKDLEELTNKIEKITQNNKKLEQKLKVATQNYEKQKKLLEARLVAIYEAGETQYLDVILSSADLSEFLSNYVLVTEIASYDTQLLEEVEEKKQIIELAKQHLDENLAQLNIMKTSQEKNSKILQNTKILREKYTAKLSEQEKEVQAQIDEYKLQYEQVNREILQTALSDGLLADYVGGLMTWPIPGYSTITSNYGMRVHPITGVYKLHTGVDVGAPMGADFVAANDGIVTKAYFNPAYGNMVMVDHGGGISTLYAHGSEILVRVGQLVKKGEPVLKVGSTGYSTGPHAHFEVRINGVVTNPMEYITGDKIPEYLKEKLEKALNTENTAETSNTTTTEETNKETTSN
ncbi:MAG: peptidoglycan DD-metalloendopeptidase family protein [Clostridia bacterium]|nr:peptidoglycan DD-metalloendopeptidase family protein [Clostridia bacterium]